MLGKDPPVGLISKCELADVKAICNANNTHYEVKINAISVMHITWRQNESNFLRKLEIRIKYQNKGKWYKK